MPLTNSGRDSLVTSITGSGIAFDNTHAWLGVGDSTVAFSAAQTDLQASVNKLRLRMDPTFPLISGNQMTFQATFGGSDANFDWEEWAIFNDPTSGIMLARKVEHLGTKVFGDIRIFNVVLTVTLI